MRLFYIRGFKRLFRGPCERPSPIGSAAQKGDGDKGKRERQKWMGRKKRMGTGKRMKEKGGKEKRRRREEGENER